MQANTHTQPKQTGLGGVQKMCDKWVPEYPAGIPNTTIASAVGTGNSPTFCSNIETLGWGTFPGNVCATACPGVAPGAYFAEAEVSEDLAAGAEVVYATPPRGD